MPRFSVISYNVNGLGNEKKRRKIFNYLHEHDFDLIFMQETHANKDTEKLWIAEWGSKIYFSHGTSAAKGVALLINRKFKYSENEVIRDPDGRFLIVALTVDGINIVCTVVYAPNTDEPEFFTNVFAKTEEVEGCRIIAGDFNTVLNPDLDIKGGKGYSHVRVTEFVNEYCEQNDLVDIWRAQHGELFKSTFIQDESTIASALMEHLDYILVDTSLRQHVESSGISLAFATDHAMPWVSFSINASPPGPGYWKFNNGLLEDEVFVQDAIKVITEVLSDRDMDIFDKWELMKFSVKQSALRRSIQIAKSQKNKLEALQKKLLEVEKQRDLLKLDNVETVHILRDHNERINLIKQDINKIYEKRTAGCMIRSRAQWYECAEKPTKYFMSLEKHRYAKKTISKLRDKSGQILDNPEEILSYLNSHFDHIFGNENPDTDPDMEYLATLQIPQVRDEDVYWLEAPIQLEEIHLALKAMNLGKCPGTDGLTIEFYCKFWPMIASHMTKLYNVVVERKIFNRSAREAITSLMGKPLKDPLEVDNWRPLSLLNNDYKIYAKIIANRMMHVAHYIIGEEQKGFIKGRSIVDNLLNLATVVDHCHCHKLDSLLIAVDFTKAFDSCNWRALQLTLQAFGYGERFIQMIMLCYNDIKTAVMNNNYWTSWIQIKVGVRQGCPLSGILYNHLMAILALRLKQNAEIKGVRIGTQVKLLDMFADDIWNCIEYDHNSFEELLFEYKEFYFFSGLKINYNKTEIMRMGSIRCTNARFYSEFPLQWSDGPINILGIKVCDTLEATRINNYDTIKKKIENTLKMWKFRNLTPIGKIQVVNTLVGSQFVYKMQALSSPGQKFLYKIKQLIVKFIWDNKRSKISYARLIAKYEEGGQQLRDLNLIDTSLKLARIPTILDGKGNQIWKQWYYTMFGVSADYLFSCNINHKDVNKITHDSVFKEILSHWSKRYFYEPVNVNMILQQNLWYNSYIRRMNKPIFNEKLYKSGVTKIVDLYDLDAGEFYKYREFCYWYPGVIDFLEYYSVLASIPRSWKDVLKRNLPSDPEDDDSWIKTFQRLCSVKPSGSLYRYLRDESAVDNSTLVILWNNELRTQLDSKSLGKCFTNLRRLTLSTKFRYFQYRILVRALNIHVSKWDPGVSPRCTFCEVEFETTIHVFCECVHVRKIWKALKKWLKKRYQIEPKLDNEEIVLNRYRGPCADLVNMFILITKFYIYKKRVMSVKSLLFIEMLVDFNRVQEIEKVIATKLGKLTKYSIKWQVDPFE